MFPRKSSLFDCIWHFVKRYEPRLSISINEIEVPRCQAIFWADQDIFYETSHLKQRCLRISFINQLQNKIHLKHFSAFPGLSYIFMMKKLDQARKNHTWNIKCQNSEVSNLLIQTNPDLRRTYFLYHVSASKHKRSSQIPNLATRSRK